jgi:hypothetical protein
MIRYCAACGQPRTGETPFCPFCGHQYELESRPAVNVADLPQEQTQRHRWSPTELALAGAALLIAATIIVLVLVVLRPQGTGGLSASTPTDASALSKADPPTELCRSFNALADMNDHQAAPFGEMLLQWSTTGAEIDRQLGRSQMGSVLGTAIAEGKRLTPMTYRDGATVLVALKEAVARYGEGAATALGWLDDRPGVSMLTGLQQLNAGKDALNRANDEVKRLASAGVLPCDGRY